MIFKFLHIPLPHFQSGRKSYPSCQCRQYGVQHTFLGQVVILDVIQSYSVCNDYVSHPWSTHKQKKLIMRTGAAASSIVAPISRSRKRKRTNISTAIISIIVTAIVVIVTVLLAIAVLSFSRGSAGTARSDGGEMGFGQKQSLRQTAADQSGYKKSEHGGLLIHTELGTVRIYFTPQLSGATSIEYIQKVVQSSNADEHRNHLGSNASSCDRCNFYRAEPDLLLQGVLSQQSVPISDVLLGPCPLADWKPSTTCPSHDPECGCHGPLMTRGEYSCDLSGRLYPL